jgi:hypothetical protein
LNPGCGINRMPYAPPKFAGIGVGIWFPVFRLALY